MFDSKNYWNERYVNGGNSGVGSYGKYATYKSEIINEFINENQIKSIFEHGCGDGNQLKLINIDEYYGYDVSEFIINNNKKYLQSNSNFFSNNINDFINRKYDLTLSLDVIYHLIEDDVYMGYMRQLFELSNKFVGIYSPNEDKSFNVHVKYRKFINDIPLEYELINKIENPYKGIDTQSDFYFFKRR